MKVSKGQIADKVFDHINRMQSKVKVQRTARLAPPPPPPVAAAPAPRGKRELATEMFLSGEGIEIGALHRPLIVPPELKVRYIDRMTVEELREHYPELEGQPLVPVDIVDDGETLEKIAAGSQDFIIANHFFEHCQDPIRTLGTLLSKLRPGGIIFMAIPNKDHTFDIKRPVTPYQHILDDHKKGPEHSKRAHFEEWTRLVAEIVGDEAIAKHTEKLLAEDYSIHFHVWDQPALTSLFFKLRRDGILRYEIELMMQNGEEVIVVLRKPAEVTPEAA